MPLTAPYKLSNLHYITLHYHGSVCPGPFFHGRFILVDHFSVDQFTVDLFSVAVISGVRVVCALQDDSDTTLRPTQFQICADAPGHQPHLISGFATQVRNEYNNYFMCTRNMRLYPCNSSIFVRYKIPNDI